MGIPLMILVFLIGGLVGHCITIRILIEKGIIGVNNKNGTLKSKSHLLVKKI